MVALPLELPLQVWKMIMGAIESLAA